MGKEEAASSAVNPRVSSSFSRPAHSFAHIPDVLPCHENTEARRSVAQNGRARLNRAVWRPPYMEARLKGVRMELKVCEGCGALWLRSLESASGGGVRTRAEAGVYCRHCAAVFADFPNPRGRSRRGRRPRVVAPMPRPVSGTRYVSEQR